MCIVGHVGGRVWVCGCVHAHQRNITLVHVYRWPSHNYHHTTWPILRINQTLPAKETYKRDIFSCKRDLKKRHVSRFLTKETYIRDQFSDERKQKKKKPTYEYTGHFSYTHKKRDLHTRNVF